MKIIALIPARKNSSRIKNKNMKIFKKKPLILRTINIAKKIKSIHSIYVSTDDENIIKLGLKSGVHVPWKRPKKLSTGKSTTESVILHFLAWYKKKKGKVDAILLLQPTSPFRKINSINKALDAFRKNPKKNIISFSEKYRKSIRTKKKIKKLKINGSLYVLSVKLIKKKKKIINLPFKKFIQKSHKESIDLDFISQWKNAEKL
jgi:CMP-N,N'-diacetyllegionaminic acid synthase|tara:strand:- start:633 stop:1244 length:612 start_codon:yes stop_codon:yes gene_type:complete